MLRSSLYNCSRMPIRPAISRSALMRPAAGVRSFTRSASALEKYYTEDHEYVDVEGEVGTVGITDYAANALGDITYVELPESGVELSQGDAMGAVESVKSASDIYAPVSGLVLDVNEPLVDKPGSLSAGPETSGWLAKIKISQPSELENLMSLKEYKSFIEGDI